MKTASACEEPDDGESKREEYRIQIITAKDLIALDELRLTLEQADEILKKAKK